MDKRLLGVGLTSGGLGMLIVIIIPWWGFIIAFIMAIVGILLIKDSC